MLQLSHITIRFQVLVGCWCHARREAHHRWISGGQVPVESCFYGKETEEFSKLKGGVPAGPLALLSPKVWDSSLGPRRGVNQNWGRAGELSPYVGRNKVFLVGGKVASGAVLYLCNPQCC